MVKKDGTDNFDDEGSDLPADDYQALFKEKKKELLLENRRARVTTMSFHDWFVKTYNRDFKPSDKAISEAYHAGAADEIENNEYIIEHAELKMNHYKNKSLRMVDQIQILYSLLDSVTKKAEMSEALKKLVRKVLSEQP